MSFCWKITTVSFRIDFSDCSDLEITVTSVCVYCIRWCVWMCVYIYIYIYMLDGLDRYQDVIGPELVTWYQLWGSKLLYFPGRSLFSVILNQLVKCRPLEDYHYQGSFFPFFPLKWLFCVRFFFRFFFFLPWWPYFLPW